MGLFGKLFRKKRTLLEYVEEGVRAQEALAKAAAIGAAANTPQQARSAIPRMVAVVEMEGKDCDATHKLASKFRRLVPLLGEMDDTTLLETCQSMAAGCLAGAERLTTINGELLERGAGLNLRAGLPTSDAYPGPGLLPGGLETGPRAGSFASSQGPRSRPDATEPIRSPEGQGGRVAGPVSASDWIRSNSRFGPKHSMVDGFLKSLKESEGRGFNCKILLAPGLSRTGRGVLAAVNEGDFFAFELSDAEVKALGIKKDTMVHSDEFRRSAEERRGAPAAASLGAPTIRDADRIRAGVPIEGEVTYRLTTTPTPGRDLALRMTCYPAPSRQVQCMQYLRGSDERVRFSFSPFNDREAETSPRVSGPIILFLELIECNSRDSRDRRVILSNRFAALVNVR